MRNTLDAEFDRLNKLLGLKRFEEALAICEDLQSTVDEAYLHRVLGWKALVCWTAGNRAEAIELISRVHISEPNWPGHLCHLAMWQLETGNYSKAVFHATELAKSDSEPPFSAFWDLACLIAAYACRAAGDPVGSRDWAYKVKSDGPTWLAGRLVSKHEFL